MTVASWINRRRAVQIEFLCKQLEVYQRIVGTGRLPYTDEERRQLDCAREEARTEGAERIADSGSA